MLVSPPVRVSHSYTQRLRGRPNEVFPLLCPVRETEWVDGWSPGVVLSNSGVAERDCVFTTMDDSRAAVWVVIEHDAATGLVEMLKVVPEFAVTRLRIALTAAPSGGTEAAVTYTYTALSASGAAFVAGRTAEAYARFMRNWEDALNRHLDSRSLQRGEGQE